MSDELVAYRLEPEGGGYRLVLLVQPEPPALEKEYRIFLHHDTAIEVANNLLDTVRGLARH